jgi:ribonuclease G
VRKLYMNFLGTEKRIAIEEGKQIVEFISANPNAEEIVDNIYLGKVVDVMPGMNAAFVDIGLDKNGYIHRDQLLAYQQSDMKDKEKKTISSFVRQGEAIIVQAVKESIEHKGPKLTGLIELAGTYVVYSPYTNKLIVSRKMNKEESERWLRFGKEIKQETEGFLFRTACENQQMEVVQAEIEEQRKKYQQMKKKMQTEKAPVLLQKNENIAEKLIRELGVQTVSEIVVDDFEVYQLLKKRYRHEPIQLSYYNQKENIFSHYRIETKIEKALQRIVELENGAYIVIDHTEALTVIDVNTGSFIGRMNQHETIVKTNELAAREIARQLRLRDIGGIVYIDFINMTAEQDRQHIINVLETALKTDRSRSNIHGFTKLGILELSRKKMKPNLMYGMTEPCSACGGSGRTLSPETMAFRLERELLEYRGTDHEAVWVEASEDIIGCILKRQNDLEKMLNLKIMFTPTERLAYHIRCLGTIKEIEERIGIHKK